MLLDIFRDGIGYVTDEVSTVKINESNLNEENRVKFVTDLAAVSRGKSESKNPPARYKSLLKEAAPTYREYSQEDKEKYQGSPSRPLEFLPVVLYVFIDTEGKIFLTNPKKTNNVLDINSKDTSTYLTLTNMEFFNDLISFSYVEEGKTPQELILYTNMRACINAGIPYTDIPYNTPEELKDFKAIKANIPMFSWAQVPNTHTMISKEAETDRHKTRPSYWMPEDFRFKVYDYSKKHGFEYKDAATQEAIIERGNKFDGSYPSRLFRKMTDEILSIQDFKEVPYFLTGGSHKTDTNPTQVDVQEYFKELGYKPEIYQRAMYYFKYKTVVMTGWKNNPKVWDHLLIERSNKPEVWKNWTQDITRDFVAGIKQIIEGE